MDVDMLKSSSSSPSLDAHHRHHHNVDMMAMMTQMPMSMPMQKQQPFPDYFRDSPSSTFSDIDFGWAPNSNPNNSNVSETLFHNYPNNNPNNLPSSVSFMGSPIQAQEPNPSPRVLMTNGSKSSSMAAMREMIFRIAAMQPIQIDPESVKAPKRRNVKISKDPQSVAARHRRERISEKMRILQRLVPGGTKMDTASMLDEAIHYVKFLKKQVQSLERAGGSDDNRSVGVGFQGNFPGLVRPGSNSSYHHQLVGSMQMLR